MRQILFFVTTLCFSLQIAAADPGQLDYQSRTLPNGLQVVTLEDFSCPIVAVQVWYHVGSKDEDAKRQGFAHMFEHMMFRGTDRLGPKAHFDLIQKVGGNCNAYTSFDNTTYINKLPANQLELVLWLESERMAFLKIDQDSFDTERAVVEEERRLGLNQPYGSVPEKVLPKIFTKHPYQWTPIGQIPHLRKSTIDELMRFWETYYVPNNATLIIVGAVKHDDAQKLAEKYFSWIPAGPAVPRITQLEPPQTEPREITISEPKGPLTIVALAYRTVSQTNPDYIPLQLLASALGGGESSRIYQDLVKNQSVAVMAGAMAMSLEQDGGIGAFGVVKPLGDKKKVRDALLAQIERLKTEPFSDAELTKAKNQMQKAEIASLQTVEGKARQLGEYAAIYGDLPRINHRLAEIQSVTADDLRRIAATYLVDTKRTSITIEPSVGEMLKGFLTGKTKLEDEGPKPAPVPGNPIAQRHGPKAQAQRPADFPADPPSQGLMAQVEPIKHTDRKLANGLKIVAITDHHLPLLTMTLGLKFGAYSDDPTKVGAASLAAGLITQGTENYTSLQLATELETHAIDLGGAMNMDAGRVSASALTIESDRAMRLLAEVARRPTFPHDEVEHLRTSTLSNLLVSSQTPSYLADKEQRARLFGQHPYARTVSGEPADVQKLTADDLKSWWQTYARPDAAVLYIAGDIEPTAAFSLAEKYLGDWKTNAPLPTPTLAQLPSPAKTTIYLVDKPGSVQSEIRVGHLAITQDNSDWATGRVLHYIFGGSFGSRLNDTLRVKKGLTYGARGGFSADRFAGTFFISTFSKTPSTAEAVAAIIEEVKTLLQKPPTDDELSTARNFLIGSFAARRETPQALVNDLWLLEYTNLPSDHLEATLAAAAKSTSDDVIGIANRRVHPANLTIVVVGDAKLIKDDLAKLAPLINVIPIDPPAESKVK